MNNIEYITAINKSLAINEHKRKNIIRCQKEALDNPDNVEIQIFMGLCVSFLSFLLPLNKAIAIISVHFLEENYDERDISKNSYPLMTIENVFENMAHDISLDFAYDIIIDKKLDCNTYAKSELKRSIKEGNLQLFKDTIKEYNIDYKPASDYCSYFCAFINRQREMESNIDVLPEEGLENNISLNIRAINEDNKSQTIKILKNYDCSDDDINEVTQDIETYSLKTLDNSSIDSVISYFLNFFSLFFKKMNDSAKEGMFNYYDKHLIGDFIEKKKAEIPILNAYFTFFTKGDLFGDDFVLEKADHTEFLKMIEQRISIETSEQQKLLENKNNNICNYELVANPQIEELPLLKDYDCNREIIMRAIEQGYMELVKVGEHYKYNWKFSAKTILYYFCGRLFMGDRTKSEKNKKNQWIKGESKQQFPRKPLSVLFLYNGEPLNPKNINQRSKGKCPKKYKDIDKLFE